MALISNNWVCLDGQVMPSDQVALRIDNASFLRGWGLFETMLVAGRTIPLLNSHLARLQNSCRELPLPFPGTKAIQRGLSDLLNKISDQDVYALRLTVTGSAQNAWSDVPETSTWLATVSPCPLPMSQSMGLRVAVSPYRIHRHRPAAGHKVTSYLDWILTRRWARQHGLDDAILTNELGHLVEASAANLFVCRNQELLTPSLDSGCLPGVMREAVLKVAVSMGIPVQQTDLTRSSVFQSRFLFLSSATTGIVPVSHWEGQTDWSPPDWWPSLRQEIAGLLECHH